MNINHRKVSLKFDGLGAPVVGDTGLNRSCGEVGENKPSGPIVDTFSMGSATASKTLVTPIPASKIL